MECATMEFYTSCIKVDIILSAHVIMSRTLKHQMSHKAVDRNVRLQVRTK